MPGEGLLFAMNDHIPLRVVPSPQEYELITTNPDEVRKREEKLKELGTTTEENLEPYKKDKPYYLMKDLNEQQIEFLKKEGYQQGRFCGLDSSSKWYLVKKPNSSESLEHYFMCEIVAEELRKYSKNVRVSQTVDPDIMFDIQKGNELKTYAIEVETGTQLSTPSDLKEKVTKNMLDLRTEDWWFLVTNSNLKKEYEKYHTTINRNEIIMLINQI